MSTKIVTIKESNVLTATNGKGYLEVTDQDNTKHRLFENLEDKWELCEEGKTVQLIKEQSGKYWNVIDVIPVGDKLPIEQAPKTTPPPKPSQGNEIVGAERGLWWKQLGDDLRSGHIDTDKPNGKLLRAAYFAEMFRVPGLSVDADKKD